MSVYASIDLGTNSVRMLVARLENGSIVPVKRYLKITRVGEGLRQGGLLSAAAKERTLAALWECRALLKEHPVTAVSGVATAALRDAADGKAFIHYIQEKLGLPIKIISGTREAVLSFQGAVAGLGGDIDENQALVVDIGGGSTELTYVSRGEIKATSRQVGAVRCAENASSEEEIKGVLAPALEQVAVELSHRQLIGVGGTITSLAAIKKQLADYAPDIIHGTRLDYRSVDRLYRKLASLSLEQRKQVVGLQPERADVIVAGIRILWVILDFLQASNIIVSEADLLYGLIQEMAS